jgi:hypothetical protein
MALTRADLITAVRRLTRLTGTVPYTDNQIADFINEAIQELSIMAPFDVYSEKIDTTPKTVYNVSQNMIDFFAVYYYPLAGDKLSSGINNTATTIPLVDASAFPSNGYAVIGDMTNWEIVRYTGKSGNSLTGVTRAVYGVAQSWNVDTPVHVWSSGKWWNRLEIIPAGSMFDVGVPDDQTVPTRAVRQGKTIILNRNPVKGYGNLIVYGFTVPPSLVNSTDTVRNLENREIVLIYLSAIKVLASLGSEEAMLRLQAYLPLFQMELTNMQQQIDKQIRVAPMPTNINIGR